MSSFGIIDAAVHRVADKLKREDRTYSPHHVAAYAITGRILGGFALVVSLLNSIAILILVLS